MGFDSLPDQLVSKSVAQGFCFNILCVGTYGPRGSFIQTVESHAQYEIIAWTFYLFDFFPLFQGETGIGKSTLMNTLFNTTFESEEASHYDKEVQLRPQMYNLQESNVNLKLTVVHTVGFGDQINKEERYRSFLLYKWLYNSK